MTTLLSTLPNSLIVVPICPKIPPRINIGLIHVATATSAVSITPTCICLLYLPVLWLLGVQGWVLVPAIGLSRWSTIDRWCISADCHALALERQRSVVCDAHASLRIRVHHGLLVATTT